MSRKQQSWPPPINGMTADEMVTQLQIASDFVVQLELNLQKVCGREVHQWDSELGVRKVEYIGVGDSEESLRFSSGGMPRDAERVEYFVRKCKRCGFSQKREGIQTGTKSPFGS
jgi:hypothetical protein